MRRRIWFDLTPDQMRRSCSILQSLGAQLEQWPSEIVVVVVLILNRLGVCKIVK